MTINPTARITFESRSDYKRQRQAAMAHAVAEARAANGGDLTATQARAVRDRVHDAWLAAHGPVEGVAPLSSAAQGGNRGNGGPVRAALTPEQHAAFLREQEARQGTRQRKAPAPKPATTPAPPMKGTQFKLKPAPLPGDLAPTPAQAQAQPRSHDDDAPAGARAVVQCIKGCGRWIAAKPGKPVARECPAHSRRPRLGLAPDMADVDELTAAA